MTLMIDYTDACDVSLDTENSAEASAGSHITGGSTYTFRRSNPHNLIHNDDVSWYDDSDFLDNYNEWDESLNTNGVELSTMIPQRNSSSRIFGLANVNHKYRTFEANCYTI